MSLQIVAKRTRKRWIEWAISKLASSEALSEEQGLEKRERLKRQILKDGERLSYEVATITLSDAIDALLNCFSMHSFGQLIAFIGDPLIPAVIVLDVRDLRCFLEKAASEQQTVSIACNDFRGSITLDMPNNECGDGEMLASGGGLFEQAIVDIEKILPGGKQFRGN